MKKLSVFSLGLGLIFAAAIAFALVLWYAFHVGAAIGVSGPLSVGIANEPLKDAINTYMEAQKTEHDLGYENYHCANKLIGFDDKYAYAWVLCSGYTGETADTLIKGTGFSIPTRFAYDKESMTVTGYEQPGDGSSYMPSLKKLFPFDILNHVGKDWHPSNEEIRELEEATENAARAQFTDEQPTVESTNAFSKTADLNLDGTNENIVLAIESLSRGWGRRMKLTIGNETVVVPGSNPEEKITVVDLDASDEFLEVAIGDFGPSGDPTTNFYRFDGVHIKHLGVIPDLTEGMIFDTKGMVTATVRAHILDTWFYRANFRLNESFTLTKVPDDFYERINAPTEVKMLKLLPLQLSPTNSYSAGAVVEGQTVTILGCDDVAWCQLKPANGAPAWFEVKDYNVIVELGLTSGEVFDGLSFAD